MRTRLGVSFTLCLLATTLACEDPVSVDVRQLRVTPQTALLLPNDTRLFSVEALGAGGANASEAGVVWSIADASVATVGTDGLVSAVGTGETFLVARLGEIADTALVEVYAPPTPSSFDPGVSYFGRRDYVEYIPGELPVILSAPHGGRLAPPEILNRQGGAQLSDFNTLPLTLIVRQALIDLTGFAPHVVLSHLDRAKLDPNREIVEAAEGNPFAERAWTEYHGFIQQARTTVSLNGEGMYFDMHGHAHPKARLELGYLLPSDDLNRPDISLSALSVVLRSSIREIGRDSPHPFAEVLRGDVSFGGFLEQGGVPAVPSPTNPMPGDDPYFTGGYSTREHGSLFDNELISGIQIEHHRPGLRDTTANMEAYADILAVAIRDYMLEHMGFFEPN